MTIKHWIAVVAVGLVVGGCTVGPDYVRPEITMPGEWGVAEAAGAADPAVLRAWWETFEDPILTSLIARVDAGSPDLQSALARIDESRALRAFASGEALPAIDAAGSYRRERGSANGFGGGAGEYSFYSAGFDAFWEIDLFGRVRRSVEAAQAAFEQSVEDFHDLRAILYAETARNYIELRTAQARLAYARANITIQRQTLDLTQNRFEAEIAPELDVAQARLILANTESDIPSLHIAESAAIHRLAALIGTTPHALRAELVVPADLPASQALPAAGLPAELLRRRPDIRGAERALAAQTARIGAAEAQRYPSFSLSGTLALQATHIADLANWDSRAFAFGPAVRWSLFDGNRLKSLVHIEEARTQQLAARYEATVLRAVEEVENALVGYVQEVERAAALRRSVVAAQQSVGMVESLYRNGLTNFQNVLDVQRSLSQQQDRLAISEGLILQQTVALYKAIGGGWEDTPD